MKGNGQRQVDGMLATWPGINHELAQRPGQGKQTLVLEAVYEPTHGIAIIGGGADQLGSPPVTGAGRANTAVDQSAAKRANWLPDPAHRCPAIRAEHPTGATTIAAGRRK
jgi:hypothetical protein